MNRSFPPESLRDCENCGRAITVVELPEGGFEANDQRDYVYADPRLDEADWVFCCAGCRIAMGIGDPND